MNTSEATERITKVMRLRHFSLKTERSYLRILVQYIAFVSTVDPMLSSEQKMERFLTRMALANYAASTQNCAFNALLFWYRECLGVELKKVNSLRAKRPILVRNAPSVDETRQLLRVVADVGGYPTRLIVHLLYGCGFRVTEPLNLRLRDVRLDDSQFIVRAGKGGKDRVVAIPCSLIPQIRAQIKVAEAIAAIDRANGVPVKLPSRVGQKYPAAQFSRQWAWLFPMRSPCTDPRTGATVRWRLLECNVQRAVQRACRSLGLDIKPHELRHSYGTHCLNRGENPRAIQRAMGHKSLETTMGYLHAESVGVKSPLEYLEPVFARTTALRGAWVDGQVDTLEDGKPSVRDEEHQYCVGMEQMTEEPATPHAAFPPEKS